LRSLVVCSVPHVKTGHKLRMRLMRKNKGCTQILASDHWQDIEEKSLPLHLDSASTVGVFSKLLRATADELFDMLTQERDILEALSASEEADALIQPFISRALQLLNIRLTAAADLKTSYVTVSGVEKCRLIPQRVDFQSLKQQMQVGSPPDGLDPPPPPYSGTLRRAKRTSASEESAYYFYQSADGQLIYLNSLNWRCLVAEAGGDSSRCPTELCATVLQLDAYSMSMSQRKKHPYLNHLPLASTLWEVELDIKPPLVSRETLSKFEKALSRRRTDRRNRDRAERRHSRQAEEANCRQAGLPVDMVLLPSAMYHASHRPESPTFTVCDPPLSASVMPAAEDPVPASTPSFAQMLRSPKSMTTVPVWGNWKPTVKMSSGSEKDRAEESYELVAPPEWNLGAMLEAQMHLTNNKKRQNKNKKRAKSGASNICD